MKLSRIGLFAPVMLMLGACAQKTDVRIAVHIDSAESTTLYLSRLDFGRSSVIDSSKVAQGHSVKCFRVAQGAVPTFYTVNISGHGSITLLAQQGERIELKLNAERINGYSVSGSPESERVRLMAVNFANSRRRVDSLSRIADPMRADHLLTQELEQQRRFYSEMIMQNPMSKANVMAIYLKYDEGLYLFSSSDDLPIIKTVASAMNALYPESDYSQGMVNDVKRIERLLNRAKLRQVMNDLEQQLPALSLEQPDGQQRQLSELKGKVVLLDFWHTQNANCLMENRELLSIYQQYASKGLEVYQVAIDSSRTQWVQALEEHRLPWVSVWAGHNAAALMTYNVSKIPSNYLIGRDHATILGKDLYGDKLRKALKSHLK